MDFHSLKTSSITLGTDFKKQMNNPASRLPPFTWSSTSEPTARPPAPPRRGSLSGAVSGLHRFPSLGLLAHGLSLPREGLCRGLRRWVQNRKWGFPGPHTLQGPRAARRETACPRRPMLQRWSEGPASQRSSLLRV